MSEKITLQDIIELLAEKHQMTKKDAEIFVRGMFELIEEALATEKYVKVKGLGTFKLTEVDSRTSVDINTGERFEIQGHTKVSFTPDSSMKDLINKPFAHFETVILNENTQLEDTETEIEGEDDEEGKEENLEEIAAEKGEGSIPHEEIMPTATERTNAAQEEGEEKNLVPPETVAGVIEKENSQAVEKEEENYPALSSAPEGAGVTVCGDELCLSEKTEEAVEETVETAEEENVFLDREAVETTEEERNKETATGLQEASEKEESPQAETCLDNETFLMEEAEVKAMIKDDSTSLETDTAVDVSEVAAEAAAKAAEAAEVGAAAAAEEEEEVAEQDLFEPENTPPVAIQANDTKKKAGIPWGIVIAIIVTLCIAGGIYWYVGTTDNDKPEPQVSPAATVAPVQPEKKELMQQSDSLTSTEDSLTSTNDTAHALPPDALTRKVAVPQSQQVASAPSTTASTGSKDIAKVSLADTVEYDITGTKTNYTLQEGESLIKVAVKFYGSKKLWPYIVKHNKDIIKNADRVPIGTTLRIPELVPKK